MPEGVIDLLEAIEIDEVHGEAATPQAEDGKRILQSFDQLGAVGQAGQRVVMRKEANAPVGHSAFPWYGDTKLSSGTTNDSPVNRHSHTAATKNVS